MIDFERTTIERAPLAIDRDLDFDRLNAIYESRPAADLLRWAIWRYGDRLALATSFQADGMAILDMAWRIDPNLRVITVDS
ncbi:MAG TPA: hypothetical protein VFQ80_02675, partial [Thermomicrobiales bacterium]|nr:hypothetical protein [Thermomicrobiales bacterium]